MGADLRILVADWTSMPAREAVLREIAGAPNELELSGRLLEVAATEPEYVSVVLRSGTSTIAALPTVTALRDFRALIELTFRWQDAAAAGVPLRYVPIGLERSAARALRDACVARRAARAHKPSAASKRTRVYVLYADLERPESRAALHRALGDTEFERACRVGGRFVAVWLGLLGNAVMRLNDEVDLLMLERLVVDLIVGRGRIAVNPLELASDTLAALRHEFEIAWPAPTEPTCPHRRRPRLRLVVDNAVSRPACARAREAGVPTPSPAGETGPTPEEP